MAALGNESRPEGERLLGAVGSLGGGCGSSRRRRRPLANRRRFVALGAAVLVRLRVRRVAALRRHLSQEVHSVGLRPFYPLSFFFIFVRVPERWNCSRFPRHSHSIQNKKEIYLALECLKDAVIEDLEVARCCVLTRVVADAHPCVPPRPAPWIDYLIFTFHFILSTPVIVEDPSLARGLYVRISQVKKMIENTLMVRVDWRFLFRI